MPATPHRHGIRRRLVAVVLAGVFGASAVVGVLTGVTSGSSSTASVVEAASGADPSLFQDLGPEDVSPVPAFFSDLTLEVVGDGTVTLDVQPTTGGAGEPRRVLPLRTGVTPPAVGGELRVKVASTNPRQTLQCRLYADGVLVATDLSVGTVTCAAAVPSP